MCARWQRVDSWLRCDAMLIDGFVQVARHRRYYRWVGYRHCNPGLYHQLLMLRLPVLYSLLRLLLSFR